MNRQSIRMLIMLLLLSACSSNAVPKETSGSTPTVGAVKLPAPMETLSSSLSTPTLALPESLSTLELHQRLDPLASTLDGCRLPCYNGLVPGQSGLREALNFYSRLGIGVPDLIPGDYQTAQGGTGGLGAWLTKSSDVVQAADLGLAPPLVDIYLQDNIVQYVYVGWHYAPPYLTLPRVLDVMGQPSQINLALLFKPEANTYALQTIYADARVGFAFYGLAPGDATMLRVCFGEQQASVTYFGAFAPNLTPMEGLEGSEFLLPLEGTLGLSYSYFVTQIVNDACLEVPSSQWTPWQALQGP